MCHAALHTTAVFERHTHSDGFVLQYLACAVASGDDPIFANQFGSAEADGVAVLAPPLRNEWVGGFSGSYPGRCTGEDE